MTLGTLWAAMPVDPSSDEARSLLRRELLQPEYQQDSPLQRLLDWFGRQFDQGLAAASRSSTLTVLAALLLLALVGVGVLWLMSRSRLTRRADPVTGPVLVDDSLGADQLRERAQTAMAQSRWSAALVDGFRALTARQTERGRLPDLPGATAHEVASALAEVHPRLAERLRAAADHFDEVLYGDRLAESEQAAAMLALDDDLVGVR